MSIADEARAEFVASNGYRVRRLADGQTKITRATVGAFEHVTWCGGDEYLAIAEHAEASRKVGVADEMVECDALNARHNALVARTERAEAIVAEVERYAKEREAYGRRSDNPTTERIAADVLAIIDAYQNGEGQ